MDEKEADVKEEEKVSEDKTEDAGAVKDGDAPKETGLEILDKITAENNRTEKLAERIEKANKITAELLARQQLGGRTETNVTTKQKEETDKEYRKRIEKELAEGKHAD